MHAVGVVLVAALPVLPSHHWVVLKLIEPRTDQGVAALDLVIQESERQRAVHGLDPERQAAQLDGQGIEVDGVDATLHHVATQDCLEARLEVVVVRSAGDEFVGQTVELRSLIVVTAKQPHERARAVGFDAPVTLQRSIQCLGKKPERSQGKRSRSAGGIAHGQVKDLLGGLRRPICRRRGRIRLAVSTDRRIVGQWPQRTLHGWNGSPGRV